MAKYVIKFRHLHPAKPNPFRRDQKIKRGVWIKDLSFDVWAEAKARCEQMNKGMREAAVFIRGQKPIFPNQYTGRLQDDPPS
jgi:hypothetical protein